MGSMPSRASMYTSCQSPANRTHLQEQEFTPEVVTQRQPSLSAIDERPPQFRRVETFEQKLYRKMTQEPLVPIGLLITAGFLTNGIRAFVRQNRAKQQVMMRGRVIAQFCTIIAIMFYATSSGVGVDWRLAPLYQDGVAMRKRQQEEAAAAAAAAAKTSQSDNEEH